MKQGKDEGRKVERNQSHVQAESKKRPSEAATERKRSRGGGRGSHEAEQDHSAVPVGSSGFIIGAGERVSGFQLLGLITTGVMTLLPLSHSDAPGKKCVMFLMWLRSEKSYILQK